MISRKKLAIGASTICLVTVTLFLQVGVFANQTQKISDFTVEAEAYDVFYDCNRDGKVDMVDIFGCILRYGTEGAPVRTSILAVSHTAFNPQTETQPYLKAATYLQGAGAFYAEIYLPDGANVTWVAVYLRDDNPLGYVRVTLQKNIILSGYVIMANIDSGTPETPGTVKMTDNTINQPIVDNNGKALQLYVYLSTQASTLELYGVFIGYEYTP